MHHKEHNTSCEVAQAALVFPDCLRLFLCQCFILHLVFFFWGTSLQKYFLEITKPYSVHKISYLSANSFYIVENVNLQLTG